MRRSCTYRRRRGGRRRPRQSADIPPTWRGLGARLRHPVPRPAPVTPAADGSYTRLSIAVTRFSVAPPGAVHRLPRATGAYFWGTVGPSNRNLQPPVSATAPWSNRAADGAMGLRLVSWERGYGGAIGAISGGGGRARSGHEVYRARPPVVAAGPGGRAAAPAAPELPRCGQPAREALAIAPRAGGDLVADG